MDLGLSEKDLERKWQQESSMSVDDVLLMELEIVIDLVREEENDHSFLRRLLQNGLFLVQVVTVNEMQEPSDEEKRQKRTLWMRTALQMWCKLCVNESAANQLDANMFLELALACLLGMLEDDTLVPLLQAASLSECHN